MLKKSLILILTAVLFLTAAWAQKRQVMLDKVVVMYSDTPHESVSSLL